MAQEQRGILSRFFGFIWWLVKLAIVIGIGIALGVGVYYGGWYAYQGLLAPINTNTRAIRLLEENLETTRQEFQRQLEERDRRIAQLSGQLEERREQTAQLERRLAAQQAEFEGQRMALVQRINQQQETIAGLREELGGQQDQFQSLEAADRRLGGDISELNDSVSDVEDGLDELEGDLAGLEDRVAGVVSSRSEITQTLQTQLLLLKAAAQSAQVRLRLIQNNPGGAQEELALLQSSLETAAATAPPAIAGDVADLQEQATVVSTAIDENPLIVSDELQVLWRRINQLIQF